jgi:hypothetical protein
MRKLVSAISDVYSTARFCYSTHDELLERRRIAVHETPAWKRSPAWVQMYVNGYEEALRGSMWHRDLAWMLWLDDKLVRSEDVDAVTVRECADGTAFAPGYRRPWSRIDSNKSRHVWRDIDSGIPRADKPFTGAEEDT